jgi:hypothetical protein
VIAAEPVQTPGGVDVFAVPAPLRARSRARPRWGRAGARGRRATPPAGDPQARREAVAIHGRRPSLACCGEPVGCQNPDRPARMRRFAGETEFSGPTASGVVSISPTERTTPSCQIATSANSRCTSSPIQRRILPPSNHWLTWESRRANDTYGSALAAHPGKSQGRPTTNTGSKPIEQERPARPAFAPECPRPGRSHRTHQPGHHQASRRSLGSREASAAFHTGYQPARTRQPRDRSPHRRRRHLPNDKSLIRLAASVVIEQNDEWLVGHRYLSAHSLNTIVNEEKETKTKQENRELTTA